MKVLEQRSRLDHLIFNTEQAALDYAAALDAMRGPFPRQGVDVGSGRHAPAAVSATLRYAAVRKHPTLAKWAVACKPQDQALDGAVVPVGGRMVAINTNAAVKLTADWTA